MVKKHKFSLHFDRNTIRWLDLFLITILVCAAYVFMEWLFIVTKPSFLSVVSPLTKILVLFRSFLVLSAICTATLVPLLLLGWIIKPLKNSLAFKIGMIIPASVMTGMFLLMIDNFTYTVFKFGISSTTGILRGIYGLLFLLLLFYSYRYINQRLPLRIHNPQINVVVIGLVMAGILISVLGLNKNRTDNASDLLLTGKRPNILLIGSDGLNANNMSVYGYERSTTPNIEKFAKRALLVRNNFTNSSNTSGSLTSILTSKHPTQTRVLYPPDILKGADAYQHLPGILKQLGYYNVQLGLPHFADAYTLGLLDGFDEVNGRSAAHYLYFDLIDIGYPNDAAYFLSMIYDRIINRVAHIFYISEMKNPYDLITKNSKLISDQDKIAYILRLFGERNNQPTFIHAHLLDTHGPKFTPAEKKFSIGSVQDKNWHMDYYDDSVYNFDILFGDLIDRLRRKNLLDNTIIVLYSDHGMRFDVNQKLPLIIFFPDADYAGEVVHISQNLDIAPTLLDYLGVAIPDWMMGNSLLQNKNEPVPIISTGLSNAVDLVGKGIVQDQRFNKPPFYQFDVINIKYCQKWYQLNLETYQWSSGEINQYDGPCPENELISIDQIQNLMLDRLSQDGFDIPEDIKVFLN